MALWTVSTTEKKSVEEHEVWVKGDSYIVIKTGFRWGTWTVTTPDDNPPEFDDGEFDIYDSDYEIELDSLDDGCWVEHDFPADMPEEEQDRLRDLIDDEGTSVLEDEGWVNDDTEHWVWCKLNIERK